MRMTGRRLKEVDMRKMALRKRWLANLPSLRRGAKLEGKWMMERKWQMLETFRMFRRRNLLMKAQRRRNRNKVMMECQRSDYSSE
jgi:hypothetical protein